MKQTKIRRSLLSPVRLFCIIALWFMGWKIRSISVNFSKYVLIGAPHTSNWDFIIGFMVMTAIGLKLSWVGKHTIFRKPFGWFMNRMGGIPVDRTKSSNFVEQIVTSFQENEKLIIAIAPEGTRKRTAYWKSGFYYIAQKAGIPIVLGFLDYSKKEGGFKEYILPTGNIQKDLHKISTFYKDVSAKFPENFGPIRFRSIK